MPEPPLVAIVDDDRSIREAISNLLQAAGWDTATFDDAASFLQSASRRTADCLVTDLRMPGLSGLELHDRLLAAGDGIPTVLITAYADANVSARGFVCCLSKPFAPDQLVECVRKGLSRSRRGRP